MTTTFVDLTISYMEAAQKIKELRDLARETADVHQTTSDRLAALTASLTMEAAGAGTNDQARRAALEGLKLESTGYQSEVREVRDLARGMAELDSRIELLGHTLRALRLRMEWEIATAHTTPANGAVTVAEMIERR